MNLTPADQLLVVQSLEHMGRNMDRDSTTRNRAAALATTLRGPVAPLTCHDCGVTLHGSAWHLPTCRMLPL